MLPMHFTNRNGVPMRSGPFRALDIGPIISFSLYISAYRQGQIYIGLYIGLYIYILKQRVLLCIEQISEWMSSNRLKLNPSKSEFLWCTTLRRRHLLHGSTFALADAEVLPADVIRNLEVYFDSCLTRTAHVSQLVRSCFYQLRRIKTIRKFIPTSIAVVLVNSFIVSRVDYC